MAQGKPPYQHCHYRLEPLVSSQAACLPVNELAEWIESSLPPWLEWIESSMLNMLAEARDFRFWSISMTFSTRPAGEWEPEVLRPVSTMRLKAWKEICPDESACSSILVIASVGRGCTATGCE